MSNVGELEARVAAAWADRERLKEPVHRAAVAGLSALLSCSLWRSSRSPPTICHSHPASSRLIPTRAE